MGLNEILTSQFFVLCQRFPNLFLYWQILCFFFFEVELTYTIKSVSGIQHNNFLFVHIVK